MKKSPFDISGQTAIITGATKGIGRQLAECFSEYGANVVVTSRNQQDCDAVAKELSTKYNTDSMGISIDVTSKASIEKMVDDVVNKYKKIDILINNAGTAITKKAEELTEDDWDRVINVDLKGVFLTSIEVGKQMISQNEGVIINVASMLAFAADKGVLPYCCAKGGVLQMTKALALEWCKYNIRVNALCPGYVKTPMNEKDLENEKISNHILSRVPMRRFANTDEMDKAAIFLASDASSYMTGQHILIDGGRMASC